MNRTTIIRILALACVFAGANRGAAKVPELDSIYYGTISHKVSTAPEPLIPGTDAIVVQAELNGVVIAEDAMQSGSSEFVLKVPIDDGADPRIPGAARRGEKVRIFVRNRSQSLEEEAIESASTSGFSLPLEKGLIVNQNLTLASDLGGSFVLPAFKRWADHNSLGNGGADVLAREDADGDGKSNMHEFLAGTDPHSALSFFSLMDVVRFEESSFVQFGPIIPERTYTIYRSANLANGSWIESGVVTPDVDAAHFWFGDAAPTKDSQFYKVEIELEQSRP